MRSEANDFCSVIGLEMILGESGREKGGKHDERMMTRQLPLLEGR